MDESYKVNFHNVVNSNRELIEYAQRALEYAYAPYSGFKVGAALLTKSGKIFTGVNIENSSYGATLCAERSALAAAVTSGERNFLKIAVVGYDEALKEFATAWPCGICRQVLAEFNYKMEVITIVGCDIKSASLDDLLAECFKINKREDI